MAVCGGGGWRACAVGRVSELDDRGPHPALMVSPLASPIHQQGALQNFFGHVHPDVPVEDTELIIDII